MNDIKKMLFQTTIWRNIEGTDWGYGADSVKIHKSNDDKYVLLLLRHKENDEIKRIKIGKKTIKYEFETILYKFNYNFNLDYRYIENSFKIIEKGLARQEIIECCVANCYVYDEPDCYQYIALYDYSILEVIWNMFIHEFNSMQIFWNESNYQASQKTYLEDSNGNIFEYNCFSSKHDVSYNNCYTNTYNEKTLSMNDEWTIPPVGFSFKYRKCNFDNVGIEESFWIFINTTLAHIFANKDYLDLSITLNAEKQLLITMDNLCGEPDSAWYYSVNSLKKHGENEFTCVLSHGTFYYLCLFSDQEPFSMQILSVSAYRKLPSKEWVCCFHAEAKDTPLYFGPERVSFIEDGATRIIFKKLQDAMKVQIKVYCDRQCISLIPSVEKQAGIELQPSLDEKESALRLELAKIIGQSPAKEMILQQYYYMKAEKRRRDAGIAGESLTSLHMVFSGNPGTGKTTFARLVAKLLRDIGLLSTGQLIETDRSGLVGQYIGSTAPKVQKVFESALGGVLFIDEAYSLYVPGMERDFGNEAISTLIKLMEDHRTDCVVILAGYQKEMSDFLSMNPGLNSRFPIRVNFVDYSIDELTEIVKKFVKQQGFILNDGVDEKIKAELERRKASVGTEAGNGRMARNFFEEIIRCQSVRVKDLTDKKSLLEISMQDIPELKKQNKAFNLESELNSVLGLEIVKQYVRDLDASMRMREIRKRRGMTISDEHTLHMIFEGNPGTGKTTMARIIGKVLFNLGIVSNGIFIEATRSDLVAGYVGQTAKKTEQIFKSALGGILFIDEAYSLGTGAENDFGREAIDMLVKLMEDYRNGLVVILAGYTDEMNQFLLMNSGLKSRFPNVLKFPDYSIENLMLIADRMFHKKQYTMTSEAKSIFRDLLLQQKNLPHFGNARNVRNMVEQSIRKQNARLMKQDVGRLTDEQLMNIEPSDLLQY